MGRLIDADELKTAFPCGETVRTESVRATIDHAPTVDAVPVVRCKDCIRFRPDDDVWEWCTVSGKMRCKDCIRFRPDDGVWGWCTVSGKMRCKDFCSYGVREDGEQHG